MDPDMEVYQDFSPLLRIYKSGRIERFLGTQVVVSGFDPATGVTSKDVVIDPHTRVAARLYLPDLSAKQPPEAEKKKLPILVYYHGGGFVYDSAFSPMYHNYLNSLVAKAKVVAISVNYRLAPENPLPAAYDDSLRALSWVAEGGAGNEWLAEHGDSCRIFIAGDSAGANIVHNVALRLARSSLQDGLKIKGMALIHPYFWGATAIGDEGEMPPALRSLAELWSLTCPDAPGRDDPRLNPVAVGAPSLRGLPCRRVLVAVALKEYLRARVRAYYAALKESGWEGVAELVESEGEDHIFHLKSPDSANAVSLMQSMVAFLNSV